MTIEHSVTDIAISQIAARTGEYRTKERTIRDHLIDDELPEAALAFREWLRTRRGPDRA